MIFPDQIPALLPTLVVAMLALAAVLGTALARARGEIARLRRARGELLDMLDRDDLTSARSRRYMRGVFAADGQHGRNALVFIDIDRFKSVNDGYGHKAGDALLCAIADALVAAARENEEVFRIGGDEFGVYLRDTDLDAATARAEELRLLVNAVSISVDGVRVQRTASVGSAQIERGQDFVGALYYADEAQYAAKTAGGNRVRANEGETLRSMIARRTGPRTEDLARALSCDEVIYHVQPIFDTQRGRPIGVEALIRWQRPDGRLMMPHQFLDVMSGAYAAGLRPPLGRAAQVARAFTGAQEDIFCAFNISSAFLETDIQGDKGLVDQLLEGLDPRRTVFEIVERAVIRNPAHTRSLLCALQEKGVRVALDDFGTGTNNLERLQDIDVDIVKIDRRFVRGVDGGGADIGILRALLDMSRDMRFMIIAEGVETQAELEILNEIGIWNAQGFLLGRPNTAAHWTATLGLETEREAPPETPLRVVR